MRCERAIRSESDYHLLRYKVVLRGPAGASWLARQLQYLDVFDTTLLFLHTLLHSEYFKLKFEPQFIYCKELVDLFNPAFNFQQAEKSRLCVKSSTIRSSKLIYHINPEQDLKKGPGLELQ